MRAFTGRQLHAAEVSTVATTTWVTTRPPRLLLDDVDGRVLFATARERVNALEEGRVRSFVAGLGDVVILASVRQARTTGHVAVGGRSGTQVLADPRLHLVGYRDWTGPASATLAGVGPSAKATAAAISEGQRPDHRTEPGSAPGPRASDLLM